MSAHKRTPKIFAWQEPFLASLRQTGKVVAACKVAGISRNSAYTHYRRYPRFRRKWRRAQEQAWEQLRREAWAAELISPNAGTNREIHRVRSNQRLRRRGPQNLDAPAYLR